MPRLVCETEAKRTLGDEFDADVVDMESYWIASVASEKNIPFLSVRTISDTVRDSLPPFDQIIDSDGKWRWQRAISYLPSHPKQLATLFVLYRNTRRARANLTCFIDQLMERL